MIIGCFTIYNEADRWLDACLNHHKNFVDELFIYDDQSTDNSVDIALKYTSNVIVRNSKDSSFIENESQFRSNAWREMSKYFSLRDQDDWILCLDADEFFISNNGNERETLNSMIEYCNRPVKKKCYDSFKISIPEIWAVDGVVPMVRIDGAWAKNFHPRFVRYKKDFSFLDKKMACGSVPTYALQNMYSYMSLAHILHFGYAIENDRIKKYNNYSSMKDHGHNKNHIESIMQEPALAEYSGPIPKFWRGFK